MRLLVTGASGQLGGYLLHACRERNWAVAAWSGTQERSIGGVDCRPVDLTDADAVAAAFRACRPNVVLHAAAVAQVSACRHDPLRARRINVEGTRVLAELAATHGARLILVSTDLVFDGTRGAYSEHDAVCPLSVYGQTKVDAERCVLDIGGTVVRVSLLFGPSRVGRPTFFDEQVAALRAGRPIPLYTDEWRTPLGLATAARALLAVADSEVAGLLHLGGPERMSRFEMGQRLAAWLGWDSSCLVPTSRTSVADTEPRPEDTSLDSSRWRGLFPNHPWPNWEDALREMLAARNPDGAT